MRLIIVGASSEIGRCLLRLAPAGLPIVPTFVTRPIAGGSRLDLLRDRITDVVPQLDASDCVILLAAVGDQASVWRDPGGTRELNVTAAGQCMRDALSRQAHVIFMSTEAVFGSGRPGACEEQDPISPLTAYGRQKAEAESLLTQCAGDHAIVRAGWSVSMNPNSRCVVRNAYSDLRQARARLADDLPLTVTWMDDVARGLLRIAALRAKGVFHLACNPPLTYAALGDHIIRCSRFGQSMTYDRVKASDLEFREPRGCYFWLQNDKSAHLLDLKFQAPETTISAKVSVLDVRDDFRR